jgi:hypothetical protein
MHVYHVRVRIGYLQCGRIGFFKESGRALTCREPQEASLLHRGRPYHRQEQEWSCQRFSVEK